MLKRQVPKDAPDIIYIIKSVMDKIITVYTRQIFPRFRLLKSGERESQECILATVVARGIIMQRFLTALRLY